MKGFGSMSTDEVTGHSPDEKDELDELIRYMQEHELNRVKPLDLLRGIVGKPYEDYKQAQRTLRWGRPAFVLMQAEGHDLDGLTVGELKQEMSLEQIIEIRRRLE